MDSTSAIGCLAALAQATRLETFRLLVKHEPGGLPAGAIGRLLGVAQNTMSTHLAVLASVGLIEGERRGRSIIYRADMARARALVLFLLEDCCGGAPEMCEPILAELIPCCPPKESIRD